jgi:hypothetical protein
MLATVSIPCSTRHSLCKSRDNIQTECGVKIFFPKNGILPNNHQEMKIEGSNLSIRKAKKMLDIVIDSAKRDYAEYKERESNRKEKIARNRLFSRKKEEEENKTSKTCVSKKSSNGFAALFEESESESESDSGVEEYPVLGNTATEKPTYWGPGMNPEPKQKEETPITSWGDVSEDE